MYRVLYVDDEPGLLEIGKLFLEQGGQFSVDLTASAPDALAQLDVRPYDAVLADYQMPVMDGIAFLKEVRSRSQDLPFILFTGRGREEVIIDAINNGADFYLQKGGDPLAQFTELSHKLRIAIERRQAQGALRDSEQRLADIINFLPDATFAIDSGGRVIAWNRAIEEMTQTPASAVLGKGDHDYAVAFYGTRRNLLIDFISESDEAAGGGDYAILKREGNVLVAETAAEVRGEHKVFLCKASPLYNKDGKIAGAIESIRDITAQKATEATLARNRDYLDSIFSSVKAGILVIDAESHAIVDVNPAAAAMIGVSREEILGKVCHRFICPTNRGSCPITDLGRQVDNSEKELVTADGRHVPIVKYVTRVVIDGRERLLETFIDNTERRRAEDELRAAYEQITASEEELREQYDDLKHNQDRLLKAGMKIAAQDEELRGQYDEMVGLQKRTSESQQMLSQVLDTVPVRVFWKDRELRYIGCNEPFARDAGFSSPADLAGRTDFDMGWKEQADIYRADDRRVIATGIPKIGYEEPQTTPDGGRIWLRTSKIPLRDTAGTITGVLGTYEDITASKEAGEALHETELSFRRLLERSFDAAIIHRDGAIVFANDEAAHLLAAPSPGDITGKPVMDFVDEASEKIVRDRIRAMTESSGTVVPPVEERFRRLDGTTIDVEVIATPTVYRKKHAILVLFRDISSRKGAEAALKESEKRYRQILQHASDGILIHEVTETSPGRIIEVNEKLCRMLGYSRDEMLEMSIDDLDVPEQAARIPAIQRQLFSAGTGLFQTEHRRKDGKRIPVEVSNSLINLEGSPAVLAVVRDMRTQKRTEQVLRETNRKLGMLSRITRHDLRNKIHAFSGYLDLVKMRPADPSATAFLERMESIARSMGEHIEFTRIYEDLGSADPVWQDFGHLVSRLELPPELTLEADLPEFFVYGDPILPRVFSNLIDNTVRHGGHATRIRVTAGKKPGGGLVIVWEDNGTGIPSHEKGKIFRQGYGKNTGLGLFLSREILSITGISISENGKPGKGARFEIVVPEGTWRPAETK